MKEKESAGVGGGGLLVAQLIYLHSCNIATLGGGTSLSSPL